MTRKELSRLYYLNREIEMEEKRLWELEQNQIKTAGLPKMNPAEDTMILAQIEDCKTIIRAKKLAAVAEYNRLTRYIYEVDDCVLRQILTLRHINGFNWIQIAMHIGGGNTPDGVRMIHDRFVKKK